MLEKIKARLPGGYYFNCLIYSFKNVVTNKCTLRDKYIFYQYFKGSSYLYKKIEQQYIQKNNNYLDINGIFMPIFKNARDRGAFAEEFLDFLYPYLFNDYSNIFGEGPYLYKNAQIQKGDIVIDAGANIGMFSALASHLGAFVYAFEPVKKVREKYLEKTSQLNSNIHIVPLALSNKTGITKIEVDLNNIGCSSMVLRLQDSIKETVLTITLDEWVKQNNITKVDFIKADIEGAERLMLEGAQETLKKFAPKLAICTYHLPDDKEVLTKLILQANPHYTIEYAWKKLYAWVEK